MMMKRRRYRETTSRSFLLGSLLFALAATGCQFADDDKSVMQAIAEEHTQPVVGSAVWLTDLDEAKKQATAENKAILAWFARRPCEPVSRELGVLLWRNLLEKPEFEAYAKKKFVLLDVPYSDEGEQLYSHFRIIVDPTLLVLTPEGEVAGGFATQRSDFSKVQEALDGGSDNAKALRRARKLHGDARAKALFACYMAIPENLRYTADPLIAEVRRTDVNNVTGAGELVVADDQMRHFMRELAEVGDDKNKMLETFDRLYKSAVRVNKPELMNMKINYLLTSAKTYEDLEEAEKALLELARLHPEWAPKAKQFIATELKDRDAFLRKMAKVREAQGAR